MINKKGKFLLTILMIVVASVAGGWYASSLTKSPAEAAARTAAPEPSPILVPAEERVLTSKIITRGTGRFGTPNSIILPRSELKSGPGRISSLPEVGSVIKEGNRVLIISGRPVFILTGKSPMYRDLGYGAMGSDVSQLELALNKMGYDPGPVDGLYDEKTSVAVSRWYRAEGWAPFETSTKQLELVRTLEQDLSLAKKNIINARISILTALTEVKTAESTSSLALKSVELAEKKIEAVHLEVQDAYRISETEIRSLRSSGALNSKIRSEQKAEYVKLSGDLKINSAQMDFETHACKM